MPPDPKDAVTHVEMMNLSAERGGMCSRAANHHSLKEGGRGEKREEKKKQRVRVGVGEGWWSYFYQDSMKTAVIFPSVCETFLHFPSPGNGGSGDPSDTSRHCGVFLLYPRYNKNIKTPPNI